MANNQYVNKVTFGNDTLMDITSTTAEEADVASGKIFFKADGSQAVGTMPVLKYYDDTTAAGITISRNHYASVRYPDAVKGKKIVSINLLDWTSISNTYQDATPNNGTEPAFYISPYGDTAGTAWYIMGAHTTNIYNAKFRYWYIE